MALSDLNSRIAAGSVFESPLVRMTANRNSFHAPIRAKMAVVASPGAASGSRILTSAPEPRAAVGHGRLLEVDRDVLQETAHQPDDERQREAQVRHDERELGVDQPDFAPDQVQRHDDRDRRHEAGHEHRDENARPEPKPEAGERVRRQTAQHQRQDGGRARSRPGC